MPRSRGRCSWGFVHRSELWREAVVALAAALLIGTSAAAQPQRVVSMNLCTDQLALMLADPGQLISVTYLVHDPNSSPMVAEARGLPANRGLAEDIVMLRPDLVVAGMYSTVATVALLERLGVPVVRFEPENSLDDVPASLRRMGALLGHQDRAEALVAQFQTDRARLADLVAALPPERAALWYARGFTGRRTSLAGDILAAAGFGNIAEELGLTRGGMLALESLLLAAPDHLVLGRRWPGQSQAQALLDHPALRGLPAHARGTPMADRDWVCGTPRVLAAVTALLDARGGTPGAAP